jgi:hypothetical protein
VPLPRRPNEPCSLGRKSCKKDSLKTNWFQEEKHKLVAFTQITFCQQIRGENRTGTYLTIAMGDANLPSWI